MYSHCCVAFRPGGCYDLFIYFLALEPTTFNVLLLLVVLHMCLGDLLAVSLNQDKSM